MQDYIAIMLGRKSRCLKRALSAGLLHGDGHDGDGPKGHTQALMRQVG